jgi:membrane protein
MIIKGYRVGPLLRRTGREILDDKVPGLAAETAYYFFFSLFPLFLFLAPMLGLIGDKQEMFDKVVGQLSTTVPGEAIALVRSSLSEVVFSKSAPGFMSLGALLALWSGSAIITTLMDALNRAYDIEDRRPWWKKKLIAVGVVAFAGIIMILASAMMLAGPQISNLIGDTLHLGTVGRVIAAVAQYALAFALLVGLAFGLFKLLPNLRQSWGHLLTAAVVTTLLWVLVTILFRLYVQNFANYNKTYGTVGGIIMLLTWMWLSMLCVLVGGELASELHHGTGAVEGRRGVTLVGRIGTGLGPAASTDRVGRVQPLAARGRDE